MKFYTITPIDEMSPSRRWFVDDIGLELVKMKYQNYKGFDRWDEFKVEETNEVGFDFGGMMHVSTPNIEEELFNCKFSLPVTHLPYFMDSLIDCVKDNVFQCSLRWWNYVFSVKVRDGLLELFNSKTELYKEMIEGFEKDKEEIYKSGIVIKGRQE